MPSIIVQKYGGTSVGSADKIKIIAAHICNYVKRGKQIVVVVSAMGKETDHLITLTREISANPDPREADQVLQTGEVKSAAFLAMALKDIDIPARSYTAAQLGLVTSHEHGLAKIKRLKDPEMIKCFLDEHVVVVAGFQGLAENTQEVTTLGRGGSDATAVAIAASLKAEECEIYTDVDGVYAIDPRVIPNAKRFAKISYSQMLEMAAAGAGVLMDRCVQMARKNNVRTRVLLSPSFGDTDQGTLVATMGNLSDLEETAGMTGIAIAKKIGLIKINNIPNRPGMAETIFHVFDTEKINIIDAQQGQGGKNATIFVLVPVSEIKKAIDKLSLIPEIKLKQSTEVSALTIVDESMKETPGFFYRITRALSLSQINIEMINSASKAITVVVASTDLSATALALAKEFDLLIS